MLGIRDADIVLILIISIIIVHLIFSYTYCYYWGNISQLANLCIICLILFVYTAFFWLFTHELYIYIFLCVSHIREKSVVISFYVFLLKVWFYISMSVYTNNILWKKILILNTILKKIALNITFCMLRRVSCFRWFFYTADNAKHGL